MLNHLHNKALAEKEGDTPLKSDIQQRIKEYMKRKYDVSVMSTLNISCCLDPRFMHENEATAIRQSIIQQGVVIARRIEEQLPPCPTADGENDQEIFADGSVVPAKKRRLEDILSTTNSP